MTDFIPRKGMSDTDIAQAISHILTEATLEGLQSDFGAMAAQRLNVDRLGFEQIRLHGLFLSIRRVHHRQLRELPDGLSRLAGTRP